MQQYIFVAPQNEGVNTFSSEILTVSVDTFNINCTAYGIGRWKEGKKKATKIGAGDVNGCIILGARLHAVRRSLQAVDVSTSFALLSMHRAYERLYTAMYWMVHGIQLPFHYVL